MSETTVDWVEHRIEQLGVNGWAWVGSHVGPDTDEMRAEAERGKDALQQGSFHMFRLRRVEPTDPDYLKGPYIGGEQR